MTISDTKFKIALASLSLLYAPLLHARQVAATNDSTGNKEKTEQLQEVVVEAASRKTIDQGIAFFPTKREKNFATNAVNLIQMMALTELPFATPVSQPTVSHSLPPTPSPTARR
ncbi:MAG: hypothetical protein K2O49_00545 [Muribaculaceae bacterium]|nr:hypothetical protein [Muribaculaceae bacterium]